MTEPEPDPLNGDVIATRRDSRGRYGAGKVKWVLAGKGKAASRRRITRITKEDSPVSAYAKPKRRAHADAPDEAGLPNVPDRSFDGYAPRIRLASGPAYVRVLSVWCYARLLVDLANREIVGHAAGARKGAKLVKPAFATVAFPPFGIDAFHSDGVPSSATWPLTRCSGSSG